mgnify:CR=1 FL=1
MKKWILFPLLAALFLSACQKTERTTEYTPDESMRLTIYTSHKEEVYMPIVREFEERTGIWVDVITGGTNELLERIESQQDNVEADVMFGGGVESLKAYAPSVKVCNKKKRSPKLETIPNFSTNFYLALSDLCQKRKITMNRFL